MRLFVTVGTQFPFDRLVRAVDEWVGHSGRAVQAFAQVGPLCYTPRYMRWASFVSADQCRREVIEATAVIAHAGMGSIITALEFGKPIIVMPRRAELGEHRNDHQLATARGLLAQGKVTVAMDEAHLLEKLNHLEQFSAGRRIAHHASPRLLDTLRAFIRTGEYAVSNAALAVQTGLSEPCLEMAGDRRRVSRRSDESGVLLNG